MWHDDFVVLQHVEFSQARVQAHDPCIGKWILNHWTTREIPEISCPELFEENSQPDVPSLLNIPLCNSYKKLRLHNHRTTINIRKLVTICFYHLNLRHSSSFATFSIVFIAKIPVQNQVLYFVFMSL